MKKIQIFTTLIVLFLGLNAQGQILKTTSLNLNSGGAIYDVAYDSNYDAYVVVGDFSTINGQSRNNLAFIDANTFTVLPQAPISSINGVIRSVEVVNDLTIFNASLVVGHRSLIYLGGDFTLINANTRVQVAQLHSSYYYANPPWNGIANYNVSSWDAEFYDYGSGSHGVNDLLIYGDTLMVVGEYYVVNPSYYPTGVLSSVLTFKADQITLQNFTPFAQPSGNMNYNLGALYKAKKFNNQIYLLGFAGANSFIQRYDIYGNEDVSFNINLYQVDGSTTNGVWDIEFFENTTVGNLFVSYDNKFGTPAHGTYRYNETGGAQVPNVYNYPVSGLSDIGQEISIERYKNLFFGIRSSRFYTHRIKDDGTVDPELLVDQIAPVNGGWYNSTPSAPPTQVLDKMNVVDNRLFISGEGMTSIGGQSRVGLAVYCLEPRDAEPFTSFDQTACEGDSSIYTIPQAEFADGYRWTYSGTGALYRTTNANPWTALSDEHLTGTNSNSIEIYFPSGATGGTLNVEPFSVCNTTTDYQYAKGQDDVITVNANPDIILNPTHVLNCYADTIHIVAQSSMPSVDYSWTYYGLGVAIQNDSVTVAQGLNLADSTYYVVTVDNPVTGCFSMDSTYFTTDLVAQSINQSAITTNPLEWTCSTDSMTINSNIVGATVTWENPSQAGTFFDPYVITSIPSGNLTVYATYLSNGCSSQADWGGIIENTLQADGMLVGYPLTGGTPIDTLSCDNSTLSIECDVTPAFSLNSTAQWIVGGVPTGSDILNLSEADAVGTNPLTFQFETTNNDNGCTQYYNVAVWYDFDAPNVYPLADQSINCSQSEITLTHLPNQSPNVIQGWLDANGSQTGVDTIVANLGEYYYHVLDTDNGCTNADTVAVTQTLDLTIEMPLDTLICPEQIVSITPTIIGNSETPSYLWSTGSTASTESATGGIDSQLWVTVTTPSGCTGIDTTTISITLPVQATITPIVACTDGSLEVSSVSDGAGNYQFSLDGSTWQTSTNFSGLVFDDYTVSILDGLGCVYEFDQTLDGTATSVEMKFAASIYNAEGDTIVLVNTTDFTGLDSIAWGLPSIADVYYEDDSTVILSIATGDWYDVELYGYLGANCVYTYTKSVYFGDYTPVFDSVYISNGIQSFVVSPNPTTGVFDVNLEFGTAQNYSIVITNSLGQPIGGMGVSGTGTVVSHSFQFPSGMPLGAYRIQVIADYDAQQKMIILN